MNAMKTYGIDANIKSVCVYDERKKRFIRPTIGDSIKLIRLYMMWSNGSFISRPLFFTMKFLTLLLKPSQPPVASTNITSSPNATIEELAEEWSHSGESLTECRPPHKGHGVVLNILSSWASFVSSIINKVI